MVLAFSRALTLLKERAFWRVLWHGILITTAAFIGLYIIVWAVLAHVSVADIWWIDILVDVVGGLAVLVLTWLLFPAVATLMISLFIERIITAVETQYYPHLPAPVPLPLWQTITVALKFTSVMVVLNLIALPLYLVPILNLIVFYGLNAYLLGREYFEMVASTPSGPTSCATITAGAPSAVPHRWVGYRRAVHASRGQPGDTAAGGGVHGPPGNGYRHTQNATRPARQSVGLIGSHSIPGPAGADRSSGPRSGASSHPAGKRRGR